MTKPVKPEAVKTDAGTHDVTPFPLFDPGDFASAGARNLDFATRAARASFGGAAQLGWEVVGFVNMRLAKDIAGAQKVMTAKTSHEAYHEQASFVEQALRDYADAASKWLHIAADVANHTLEPLEARTEEVLEELDERGARGEARSEAVA
ncbi:phasin family protein [Hyphococcus sp.]|jgi:hypothetical protein|uniref:phasin family protein n=1 Tax=Hyphococcus sp. TaxID=2038636 RepID=UPI003D13C010